MGTRHQQKVINKKGEIKLSQYGQWDGHPDRQGVEILRFLLSSDIKKYQIEINKLKEVNNEQMLAVNNSPYLRSKYPYLSRDCGSGIHKMIEDGVVEFIEKLSEDEAEIWCEGFYTIDFSKNLFTIKYRSYKKEYSLDKLPTENNFLSDYKKWLDKH